MLNRYAQEMCLRDTKQKKAQHQNNEFTLASFCTVIGTVLTTVLATVIGTVIDTVLAPKLSYKVFSERFSE